MQDTTEYRRNDYSDETGVDTAKVCSMWRWYLAAAFYLFLVFATAKVSGQSTNLTFTWVYPIVPLPTNMVFKVYHSRNFTNGWQVISYTRTNAVKLPVALFSGSHYYYATATNKTGESVASNFLILNGQNP